MSKHRDNIHRLLGIVARLRAPGGCPWDRKQTHRTLRWFLVEECYEVIDAIESGDPDALKEELGDLLLQIVLQAQLASEKGWFNFDDVAGALADKLVRRHPHVFGKRKLRTAMQVLKQWHELKGEERRARRDGKMGMGKRGNGRERLPSVTDGIPKHLPALMKAEAVQRRVGQVGFDWDKPEDVLAKIEEELHEVRRELQRKRRRGAKLQEELGDLLFAVVNLARFQKLHAEELLGAAVNKFIRRFRTIEAELQRRGKRPEDCTLAEMDAIWESVKRRRRQL